MQKTSKTILFFGNERLATGVSSNTPVFKKLIEQGYDIAALIISQEDLGGNKTKKPEIVEVAEAHGIKVLSFDSLKTATEEIASFKANTAVLVSYGKIVPESILNIFKVGIINIHPSLLPKHRGPTPIESVLLKGDGETGVSIMKLGKGMDSGPIYLQQRVELSGKESKQELADRLNSLGAEMIASSLESIIDGGLQPKEQSEDNVTYDKLIKKEDGFINWNRPAIDIDRQVRAYSIWPRSRTSLAGNDVIILESHVDSGQGQPGSTLTENNQLAVFTSDGILIIDKLLPAGKKEMSGQSFIAGYSSRL